MYHYFSLSSLVHVPPPHLRTSQNHDKPNTAIQEWLEMQESNLSFETHATIGRMRQHAQGLC